MKSFQREVLGLAIDGFPCWAELVDAAREYWPGVPEEETVARVRRALLDLKAHGWIEIGWSPSISTVEGEKDDPAEAFWDESRWQAGLPRFESALRICATEKGAGEYYLV